MVKNTAHDAQTSHSDGGAADERETFEPPSLDVIYAIADLTDADPETMPPLYDAVDTDALDTLLNSETPIEIRFEYQGHTVAVTGDGEVRVDGRAHRSE